jgi:hypothetical protein
VPVQKKVATPYTIHTMIYKAIKELLEQSIDSKLSTTD